MSLKPTRFTRSIILKPDDVAVDGISGELKVGLTSKSLHVYLDLALRTVVTTDQVQTLSNKTINAPSNTITNLAVTNLAAGVLNTSTTLASATDSQVPSALAAKTFVDTKTTGPGSAADNALVRFDGTTGKLVQNSTAILDDVGTLSVSKLDVDQISIDGGTISTTNVNGDLTLTPNGTGRIFTQNDIRSGGRLSFIPEINGATGANATIAPGQAKIIRLNASGLASVDMITPLEDGQELTLVNVTGADVLINNDLGATAASRVITGTGTNFTLKNQSTIDLRYTSLEARWFITNAPGVKGPLTSTDKTLPRFNGATGQLIQGSGIAVSDVNAITGATVVVASNTITTAASGNLAATELNNALSELQTDIDTRATSTALTSHTGASTGVHGVAGAVVGTTDAQTLSAKSLVDASTAIVDSTDATKKVIIDASGATATSTTILSSQTVNRTLTLPDATDTLATVTQVNAKVTGPAASTANAVARFDGTTGKIVKDSSVAISDTNIMSGLAGLTTSGDLNSTGKLVIAGITQEGTTTDGTTNGANVTLATPTNGILRVTHASLVSVDMISGPLTGQNLTLINHTGVSITLNNNLGATAANRILTGTKANLAVADEASVHLKYDATEARWMVVGGTATAGLTAIKIATISDTIATATNAGSSVAGTQTRVLNTIDDPYAIVSSLATNQFTLPIGDYYIEALAPCRGGNTHQVFLFNVTDAANAIIGSNELMAGADTQTNSVLMGKISITAAKTFELRHWIQTALAGAGLGTGNSSGLPGVFSKVKITKVS